MSDSGTSSVQVRLLGLPVEKKARHLAGMAQVSDLLAARLMIAYHLEHQRPMMGAFLDLLGIAHEDGLIKDEEPKQPDKDIAEIETAAQVDDALAALKARLAGGGPASSIPVNA